MSEQRRPPFPLAVIRAIRSRLRLDAILARLPPSGGTRPGGGRSEVAESDHQQAEKLRVQAGVIRRALGEDGVAAAPVRGADRARDEDAAYLFRPGHLLVRADRAEEVFDFFARRREEFRGVPEQVESPPTEGLLLVRVPARTDGRDDVLATLDELDEELGDAPVASPDHVLYVTRNIGGMCPATEPELPPSNRPVPRPTAKRAHGEGVRVAVVDTGLWEPATTSTLTPWLHGVIADPADVEVVDPAAIHEYGGHGTFVAGVIRCFAPAAHLQVQGALTHGGAVYESQIVAQLDQALHQDDHPQLVSISAGTHSRGDFALISFEMLHRNHGLDGAKALVVAAAGNDSSDRPFWPAAFDWAVGVGSVDKSGAVSDYSNVGGWVDLYARGRDLVNAFPVGTYTCYEPAHKGEVRTFGGLAQWSGTSFSTPVVTGLIAAHLSAHPGSTARDACAAVSAAGTTSTDPRGGSIVTVGPLV